MDFSYTDTSIMNKLNLLLDEKADKIRRGNNLTVDEENTKAILKTEFQKLNDLFIDTKRITVDQNADIPTMKSQVIRQVDKLTQIITFMTTIARTIKEYFINLENRINQIEKEQVHVVTGQIFNNITQTEEARLAAEEAATQKYELTQKQLKLTNISKKLDTVISDLRNQIKNLIDIQDIDNIKATDFTPENSTNEINQISNGGKSKRRSNKKH
jgi:hypothetical protein